MRKILTGLLCAFAAVAAEAATLPSGYQAVEYIESTVSGKQYIDTGYVPTFNTRVEADFNPLAKSDDWAVFFGVTSDDNWRDGVLLRYSNGTKINGWFCNEHYEDVQIDGLENTRIKAVLKEDGMTLNGQTVPITRTGEPYNGSIYLFCGNNRGGEPWRYHAMRLYSFKIYENDELKRDFVPCIETATSKAGLYETVEGKFYGNAGDGKFLASLPSGYLPTEYIESTVGGGQYINTEYTPHKDTKVVCSMLDMGTDASREFGAAFGSRFDYYQQKNMYLWLRRYWRIELGYGRAGTEVVSDKSTFPFGEITTVTCQGATCSWVSDSGTKNNSIVLTDCKEDQKEGFAPMLIFAMNSSNVEGGCKPTDCWGFRLYSFQIFEGEKLERDFVPCVATATGKAGLYDRVYGKFYGNAGGGDFLMGVKSVPYWDPVAKAEKFATCETVTSATTTFEDGKWYAAMGQVTCGSLEVKGSVNLILVDGCSFTSNGGIQVDPNNSFTVYGQRAGTGTLTANGDINRAGIGGVNSNYWSGYGSYGDITINGGVVNAKGGDGRGAASGGAAGIGGGPDNASGGTVTIHGGTVTAVGGHHATGIGGGHSFNSGHGNSGPIVIDGGAIDARPGSDARNAIGVQSGGTAGSIAISGGIFASKTDPGWLASGYFCGVNMDSQTSAAYPWKIKVIVPVSVRFIRTPGVTALLYRTDSKGEFVPFPDEGMNMLAGTQVELQVQLAPGFRYQGDTSFQVDVFDVLETISADVQYVNEKGETCFTEGLPLTQVNGSTNALNAGWYVAMGTVECGTLTVNGAVRLVLVDGGSLTVNGGIRVEAGHELTVYGQSAGTGELKAIGASRCAGIGAGPSGNSGTVAIHGGKIDARAGDGAKDDIGAGGGGTAGPITITAGLFARKPKEAWIAEGSWISANCQPGKVAAYPWKVQRIAYVPVRLIKGTGVDELLFHRENEDEFEPFPAGGTNLLVGAWVRIRVLPEPGYVYVGDMWFSVEASGLTKTITSIEIEEDGDGSSEHPWLIGNSVVAWTNGIGGLSVYGEGPMDDCIDVYGPIWTAFADDITELAVAGDVTAIGAGAFAGLANLTNVTVSADQLVTIGDYAFADCWSLADLTLPDSVENIGESAFEYCLDLRSCDLPENLQEIGARAFLYCWTLTELDIPDYVLAIGDQAFAGCSWIERLGLGSGLVWLGDSAFSDCTSIRAISIRAEEPPSLGDKAFYFVPTSATLTVPPASVDLYKTAKGWENFNVQPAADPSNETDRSVVARPTLAARLASATLGAMDDKPAFEVVREEGVVRVTVRLPQALPGILYRILGSSDLTFANPTEIARGTASGTDGLELSGTVPDGAACFFRVDVEGVN